MKKQPKQQWLESHPDILYSSLSNEAIDLMYKMSLCRDEKYRRIDWDSFFMKIALETAKRSPDSQTQVGVVIVNDNKHIVGTGYNGWMSGIDDSLIPNMRPLKHMFAIHAEENALLNCEQTRGAVLYCTHKPCPYCLQKCVVSGIREVVYINCSTTNSEGQEALWEIVTFLAKDKIATREFILEIS